MRIIIQTNEDGNAQMPQTDIEATVGYADMVDLIYLNVEGKHYYFDPDIIIAIASKARRRI